MLFQSVSAAARARAWHAAMAAWTAYGPTERPVLCARSRAASPRPTSIQSQSERSWSSSRIGSPDGPVRAAARGLQLHQGEQAVYLRLGREQRAENASQPERLLDQLQPEPVVARGRRI